MFEYDPYAFCKSAFEFPSTQILGARNYIAARANRETLQSNAPSSFLNKLQLTIMESFLVKHWIRLILFISRHSKQLDFKNHWLCTLHNCQLYLVGHDWLMKSDLLIDDAYGHGCAVDLLMANIVDLEYAQ